MDMERIPNGGAGLFVTKVNKFLSVVERELDESLKKLPITLDEDEGLEVCYRIM
jgi:hypothetical protein